MSDDNKILHYLHDLPNHKLSEDAPNIRDWKVIDADDRNVGQVDSLLVNTEKDQIVYIEIEVDPSIISDNFEPYSISAETGMLDSVNEDGETHLIIPVGYAEIEEKGVIRVDEIDRQTFAETKRFRKGTAITPNYEQIVRESYTRRTNPADFGVTPSYYEGRVFDNSRFLRRFKVGI